MSLPQVSSTPPRSPIHEKPEIDDRVENKRQRTNDLIPPTPSAIQSVSERIFRFLQPHACIRSLYVSMNSGQSLAKIEQLVLRLLHITPKLVPGQDGRQVLKERGDIPYDGTEAFCPVSKRVQQLMVMNGTEDCINLASSTAAPRIITHAELRILLFFKQAICDYRSGTTRMRSITALMQVGTGLGKGEGFQACHHALLAERVDNSYAMLQQQLEDSLRAYRDSKTPINEHLILRLIHLGVPGSAILELEADVFTHSRTIAGAVERMWMKYFPTKILEDHLRKELTDFLANEGPLMGVRLSRFLNDTLNTLGVRHKYLDVSMFEPIRKAKREKRKDSTPPIDTIIHTLFRDHKLNASSLIDSTMPFYYDNNATVVAPKSVNECDNEIEAQFRPSAIRLLLELSRLNQSQLTPQLATARLANDIERFLEKKLKSPQAKLAEINSLETELERLREMLEKNVRNECLAPHFLQVFKGLQDLSQTLEMIPDNIDGTIKTGLKRTLGSFEKHYRFWRWHSDRISKALKAYTVEWQERVKKSEELTQQYFNKPLNAYLACMRIWVQVMMETGREAEYLEKAENLEFLESSARQNYQLALQNNTVAIEQAKATLSQQLTDEKQTLALVQRVLTEWNAGNWTFTPGTQEAGIIINTTPLFPDAQQQESLKQMMGTLTTFITRTLSPLISSWKAPIEREVQIIASQLEGTKNGRVFIESQNSTLLMQNLELTQHMLLSRRLLTKPIE